MWCFIIGSVKELQTECILEQYYMLAMLLHRFAILKANYDVETKNGEKNHNFKKNSDSTQSKTWFGAMKTTQMPPLGLIYTT